MAEQQNTQSGQTYFSRAKQEIRMAPHATGGCGKRVLQTRR
ncbi:hypothetical protein HMPREF0578_0408 [Mobiluncus mulieris 28-1]|nr:hypothetical protein HMPREF0578_0408 [Mobiluncus mulieris 28-1]